MASYCQLVASLPGIIGVEAGQFSGVRRIFAQISPNVTKTDLQTNDYNSFHVQGVFFQIKAIQAPFLPKCCHQKLAQISSNLRKSMTLKKTKTSALCFCLTL